MENLIFTSKLNFLPLPLKLSKYIDEISGTQMDFYFTENYWKN